MPKKKLTPSKAKPLSASTSLNQPTRTGRTIGQNLKITRSMVNTATAHDKTISGGVR